MHDANVDRYAPIVAGRLDAHREELAVLVERELGVRHVIAAVRVGQERFAALARPLDRAVDALARPDDRGLFGVQEDLRAEAAADVGRDHAHLVLRQSQHERRHQQALDVRVLARHVERVAVVGAGVRRDRGARLDRVGNEAVVDDVDLRDVRGLRERRVDRRLVAERPRVALVAGRLVVDLRRAGLQRIGRVDDRRQHFVVDFDQLGGVLRLVRASRR